MQEYTEDEQREREEDERREIDILEMMAPGDREAYLHTQNLFHHAAAIDRKPEFLIDGFLPLRYCVILAGEPKAGKTALASAIALAVAEGSPFAGMESIQGGVLWLSLEESPEERATVMSPVMDRVRETDFYITHQKIAIDTEDGLDDLRIWANEIDAKLVVVDPLHAAHSGRSLADGWNARRTLAPFKKFCYDNHLTGIVLHHIGKSNNRVAENAQLAACAGMSMLYTREHTENGRIIRLDAAGRGEFANRTWHFESRSPLSYWPSKPSPSRRLDQPDRIKTPPKYLLDDLVREHLANSKEPQCASEIAGDLQRNPNSIRNSIARLLSLGRIRLTFTLSGARHYDIPREVPHIPARFNSPDIHKI